MKSALHPDGVRRITMKMEVAVDIDSLTLYALDMVSGEPNPVDIVLGANKREIFALARANILCEHMWHRYFRRSANEFHAEHVWTAHCDL
jgi:hypothetical protein